jgi:uncharacterized protein Yka (UPF0111/DUF47 family)
MPAKALIIAELGEQALLLPQRFDDALAANDRVKFYLTFLQSAERRADHPEEPCPDFSAERRALSIPENGFDHAMADALRLTDGSLSLEGAETLRDLVFEELEKMRAPLALANLPEASGFAKRANDLAAIVPDFADDHVPPGVIDSMTSAEREKGDTVHLLVMDMHKALNALQGDLAEESVGGARVWRILDEDRSLVAAFMAGLNETAPLKFEHPGLDTTATRVGEKLVIQNDIGTTDAHVLVVHVDGHAVTLTYTDVHEARAAFFESLFKPFDVRWDDTRSKRGETLEKDNYYLCTGRFEATDQQSLERYLRYLGSRIVFLIDWNKARKRLNIFLPKRDSIRLLKWAADNNVGHRGFLKLGGERLISEAIEFAQERPLHYGEALHEVLGASATYDFLKFVLRSATDGLVQGHSERFISDQVKAELARHFLSAEGSILSIANHLATLVFDLAASLRDGLVQYRMRGDGQGLTRLAERAKAWEQDADALVVKMGGLVRRLGKLEIYGRIAHEADDAADGLEEAAFLATFLAKLTPPPALLERIEALATLLVEDAQEQVKMFEAAAHVNRDGAREDLQDFLEAVDRIVALEHRTDEAERRITEALIDSAPDFRTLHLLTNIAHALEESADALSRTALGLRDHLLDDVMAG